MLERRKRSTYVKFDIRIALYKLDSRNTNWSSNPERTSFFIYVSESHVQEPGTWKPSLIITLFDDEIIMCVIQ